MVLDLCDGRMAGPSPAGAVTQSRLGSDHIRLWSVPFVCQKITNYLVKTIWLVVLTRVSRFFHNMCFFPFVFLRLGF